MRIVVEDLQYRYPGAAESVINGVSCVIPPGSRAAVVGPSGSGKTTLISLVGGLLAAQQGACFCVDEDGVRHPVAESATWVPQTVSLLPSRTVMDNVCLGAYLAGSSWEEGPSWSASALQSVGLSSLSGHPARLLSGGEAQRVAIARALASRRTIILADEPTGQLDRATTQSVLQALFSDRTRTVVVVTHDAYVASQCDTVLSLCDGVLEQVPA